MKRKLSPSPTLPEELPVQEDEPVLPWSSVYSCCKSKLPAGGYHDYNIISKSPLLSQYWDEVRTPRSDAKKRKRFSQDEYRIPSVPDSTILLPSTKRFCDPVSDCLPPMAAPSTKKREREYENVFPAKRHRISQFQEDTPPTPEFLFDLPLLAVLGVCFLPDLFHLFTVIWIQDDYVSFQLPLVWFLEVSNPRVTWQSAPLDPLLQRDCSEVWLDLCLPCNRHFGGSPVPFDFLIKQYQNRWQPVDFGGHSGLVFERGNCCTPLLEFRQGIGWNVFRLHGMSGLMQQGPCALGDVKPPPIRFGYGLFPYAHQSPVNGFGFCRGRCDHLDYRLGVGWTVFILRVTGCLLQQDYGRWYEEESSHRRIQALYSISNYWNTRLLSTTQGRFLSFRLQRLEASGFMEDLTMACQSLTLFKSKTTHGIRLPLCGWLHGYNLQDLEVVFRYGRRSCSLLLVNGKDRVRVLIFFGGRWIKLLRKGIQLCLFTIVGIGWRGLMFHHFLLLTVPQPKKPVIAWRTLLHLYAYMAALITTCDHLSMHPAEVPYTMAIRGGRGLNSIVRSTNAAVRRGRIFEIGSSSGRGRQSSDIFMSISDWTCKGGSGLNSFNQGLTSGRSSDKTPSSFVPTHDQAGTASGQPRQAI